MKKPVFIRIGFEVTTEAILKDKLTKEEDEKCTATLRNLNSVFLANHFGERFFSIGHDAQSMEMLVDGIADENTYAKRNDDNAIDKSVKLVENQRTINVVWLTLLAVPMKKVYEDEESINTDLYTYEELVKLTYEDRLALIKSILVGEGNRIYICTKTSIGDIYLMHDSYICNYTPFGTRLLTLDGASDLTETELEFTTYRFNTILLNNKKPVM